MVVLVSVFDFPWQLPGSIVVGVVGIVATGSVLLGMMWSSVSSSNRPIGPGSTETVRENHVCKMMFLLIS